MDGLLIAGFVLAVLACVAWLFTAAALAYAFWRWAYTPWRIMRLDVRALADKMKILEASLRRDSIQTAGDDAHVARTEARLEAQRRAQMAAR